ncbi:uncharacterized protein PRCAT00004357001 [Priceomyces carsonii]|uniref:uncharacterized protein n=1 Tax=Priceomyces carsonii TaxID=28549 RepID=UPI002ED8F1E2|nr:unnamed protein product [Priceomyces carsonii]
MLDSAKMDTVYQISLLSLYVFCLTAPLYYAIVLTNVPPAAFTHKKDASPQISMFDFSRQIITNTVAYILIKSSSNKKFTIMIIIFGHIAPTLNFCLKIKGDRKVVILIKLEE